MKSKISVCISVSAILMALALAGCGVPKQLSKDCGGDFQLACTQLFGASDSEHESDQDDQLQTLRMQIAQLTALVNSNEQIINSLSAGLSNATAANNANHSAILMLQGQSNNLLAQLTALNLGDPVVAYLDCGGDGPGFDEVVLRTKSGKLVAYFKDNGSREFLTLLTAGSYQTTDGSSCPFTVTVDGKFCDSIGCR